jgi:hypothetical protein
MGHINFPHSHYNNKLFFLDADNIFSESEWILSWLEAIQQNKRYVPLVYDNVIYPFVIHHRKRPHLFNRFLEYPAQEIAYDINIKSKEKNFNDFLQIILSKKNSWDVVNLSHLCSQSISGVEEMLSGRYIYKIEKDDLVWDLHLPENFEQYLSLLDKKHCHKLRYYLNRIRKIPSFKFYFANNNFEFYWRKFIFLHQERITAKGERTLFASKLFESFYRAFSGRHYQKGNLRFACLSLGEELVAIILGVEKYNCFYYINSGFSKKIAKYSPGITLSLLCIDYAINNGLKKFSFLGGDESYKKTLGAKSHSTSRLRIFRNNMIYLLEESFAKFIIRCRKR